MLEPGDIVKIKNEDYDQYEPWDADEYLEVKLIDKKGIQWMVEKIDNGDYITVYEDDIYNLIKE